MPAEPTLAEIIRGAMDARASEIMTSTVGKVQVYDPVRQVADVQPIIKRPYNIGRGEVDHEELPVLPNVPVVMPRAGGFVMHMPIVPGDYVLLVFTHDSIAMWREKGGLTEPGDLRRHSLANAVAIAGISPEALPLSPDPTQVAARTAGMVIGKDGGPSQIEITPTGIGLGHLAIAPVALAPLCDANFAALFAAVTALTATVAGIGTMLGSHTHPVSTTGSASAQAGTASAIPSPPAPPTPAPPAGPTVASTLVKAL